MSGLGGPYSVELLALRFSERGADCFCYSCVLVLVLVLRNTKDITVGEHMPTNHTGGLLLVAYRSSKIMRVWIAYLLPKGREDQTDKKDKQLSPVPHQRSSKRTKRQRL